MVRLWLTCPVCCCFRVTLGEDPPAQSRSCESQPEQDQDKKKHFFTVITMHRNSPRLILSLYILSNGFFKVKCINSRTHTNNSMSCLTKDLAAQVNG